MYISLLIENVEGNVRQLLGIFFCHIIESGKESISNCLHDHELMHS